MSCRPVIESAAEAARRIGNGAAIAIPGNNFRLAPETLLAAIESAHRETGGAIDVKTVLVRPAVTNSLVHPRQELLINRFSVVSNDAYDSTHCHVY